MKTLVFLNRQLTHVREGGLRILAHKIRLIACLLAKILVYFFVIPVVLILRLIEPIILVRIGNLVSSRIGHFVANTEIYMCEKESGINKPKQRYVDLLYLDKPPICNTQLLKMWRRELRILPHSIMQPIDKVNRYIPGGDLHVIQGMENALDIKNLFEKYPSHLKFTLEEEVLGERCLREMGVPFGKKFICLNVRDNAYLKSQFGHDFSYHDYRDSDINSYTLAAEGLAEHGYYVIRMGAKVNAAINSNNRKIIDYATNGMRNEFMDIYLGAKCYFAISTGSGWDAIPEVSRRPIVYVNYAPLGFIHTFRSDFIAITKKYYSIFNGSELALSQIVLEGAAFYLHTEEYTAKGIKLKDNTPEEIYDVVMEMLKRLNGTWLPHKDDEVLQEKFWDIFPVHAIHNGLPLHGKIQSRYGAMFLRNNQKWLE